MWAKNPHFFHCSSSTKNLNPSRRTILTVNPKKNLNKRFRWTLHLFHPNRPSRWVSGWSRRSRSSNFRPPSRLSPLTASKSVLEPPAQSLRAGSKVALHCVWIGTLIRCRWLSTRCRRTCNCANGRIKRESTDFCWGKFPLSHTTIL